MSPWLSQTLRTRGGVFATAAERFLVEWLGNDAPSYPGGARGLIGLCGRMEHWLALDDVDEEGERRFVEGAGALLGLLLIEHVGDARHAARGGVHRVQLGAHGFFDPFAAIDRALDADDVRSELARQVGVAEAEARSEGPVSRVALALLTAVARERPDLCLDDHFDLSLSLRGGARNERLEIDLRRAVESTRDQGSDAVARVAGRLLTMLPGAPETELALADVHARLVPRLARRDLLRELSGGDEAGALHASPLTEELAIALMLEYQGRARYVRASELAGWDISEPDALALAITNLTARSREARIAGLDTEHGQLLVARSGDGRDSARVLLRGLYHALAARLGADVYVGIPHRDTFFACGAGQPKLLEELARRTARDAERAPHKLSARIYRLTDKGLRGLD